MASSFNVAGDRDELTRLFDNLVDNALKYGAAAKRVELKLSPAEPANGSDPVPVANLVRLADDRESGDVVA